MERDVPIQGGGARVIGKSSSNTRQGSEGARDIGKGSSNAGGCVPGLQIPGEPRIKCGVN